MIAAEPSAGVLLFTTGSTPIDAGAEVDIEAQCWRGGFVFPARQVIVRPLGFIGTPSSPQFALVGLTVGGKQQLLTATGVPFQALVGPDSALLLPTARVTELIVLRVANLGDEPAPFTALMNAVVDDGGA